MTFWQATICTKSTIRHNYNNNRNSNNNDTSNKKDSST